jgi:hypothetical protein
MIVRRDVTLAALWLVVGLLLLGSVAAFLLLVPVLPLAAVVTVLVALALMFTLGVQTGSRGAWLRRAHLDVRVSK